MKELRVITNWRKLVIKYKKIRNYDLAKILTPSVMKKLKIKTTGIPKIKHDVVQTVTSTDHK